MSKRLHYSYEEIMMDHDYVERIHHDGRLFHGGLDAAGRYVPPRSRHRLDAIAAWRERLEQRKQASEVVRLEDVERAFFPNVAQAKLLLRSGAKEALTRILTLIGVTEGFGNDGIRALPAMDLSHFYTSPLEDTCLGHLRTGLMEAHGNDEAGRGDESGHDQMWYAIRDAALERPTITADMFENLPIAPPPGYEGPAKPGPEAIGVSSLASQLFPELAPMFELTLTALAQILVIELMAFSTFAWAREVLADPLGSAAPTFGPTMVDRITVDEGIHVGYLQCALAETRCRLLVSAVGGTLGGAQVVDAIVKKIVAQNTGARWDRMNVYRMKQIRAELERRRDGERLLAEFAELGPVPAESAAVALA